MQPQHYHDPTQNVEVVWRPMPMSAPLTQYPGHAPNPIAPGFLKIAGFGAVAFVVTGLAGGLWIGTQLNQARLQAALAAENEARQKLTAVQSEVADFCKAAANPSAPKPADAVAAKP